MVDHVHLGRVWGKHGHLRTLPTEVDQAAGERGERGEGVQESYSLRQGTGWTMHTHADASWISEPSYTPHPDSTYSTRRGRRHMACLLLTGVYIAYHSHLAVRGG